MEIYVCVLCVYLIEVVLCYWCDAFVLAIVFPFHKAASPPL